MKNHDEATVVEPKPDTLVFDDFFDRYNTLHTRESKEVKLAKNFRQVIKVSD